MEYSIQALSRLSGVTTRTLRWYDEIGLLKPSRVAESGYRYYGPAEVDRLQDILYYRALGVELARIKRCLDDPSFDRLAALRSHLTALEAERARLEGLIRSVRQTIGAEERKEIMDDKQKFEAFKQRVVDWHQETYGAEARGRYGDAGVDEAQTAVLNLTPEQYQEWTRLGGELQTALERAVASGASPEGEDGRAAAALHRRWLTLTGNQYDPAKHRGLAELYVSDPRFTAYYDRAVPGSALFQLVQAVLELVGHILQCLVAFSPDLVGIAVHILRLELVQMLQHKLDPFQAGEKLSAVHAVQLWLSGKGWKIKRVPHPGASFRLYEV